MYWKPGEVAELFAFLNSTCIYKKKGIHARSKSRNENSTDRGIKGRRIRESLMRNAQTLMDITLQIQINWHAEKELT